MMNKDGSDVDSDEENEEGDYTVYECPGLAPVNTPFWLQFCWEIYRSLLKIRGKL